TLSAGVGQMQVACDGSNLNPVALNILRVKKSDGNYYIPGSSDGTFQQIQFTKPARFNEHQYIANVDYLASSKHSFAMRYLYSHDPQTVFLAGQVPGWTSSTLWANTNSSLRFTSLVTRNLSERSSRFLSTFYCGLA